MTDKRLSEMRPYEIQALTIDELVNLIDRSAAEVVAGVSQVRAAAVDAAALGLGTAERPADPVFAHVALATVEVLAGAEPNSDRKRLFGHVARLVFVDHVRALDLLLKDVSELINHEAKQTEAVSKELRMFLRGGE